MIPVAESVFVRIPALAARHGAVNLAQGVFDHGPPDALLRALVAAGQAEGAHQYAPSAGLPRLRQAVARRTSGAPDPDTEVTITAGATEALHCAMLALLRPGDEAIVVEPAYEQYGPAIRAAGGVVVPVRLADVRSSFADLLDSACTERTRVVVVNSPWNPLGRVLTAAEWTALARLARRRGVVVVSDETYEHLIPDRHRGVLDAVTDPELRVKVSSVSKSLAATGWRVGWAVAGPGLTRRIRAVHQYVTFCPAVPLQHAVADVLDEDFGVVAEVARDLRDRATSFAERLTGLGLRADVPACPFYLVVDVGEPAEAWCDRLVLDGGVAALPLSVFYSEPASAAGTMVRFAVCKRRETLDTAARRLAERLS
ncbi:pyridoxal phosphate-dependent aminotransferase [Saccharothrix sp. HUAS TT1]|uniref:pyridoxal phosphate-dependent aminotransferase n=1 Tax=unclassified Saccharothrix TaxID=2593673 RepID=UPI00345B78A1